MFYKVEQKGCYGFCVKTIQRIRLAGINTEELRSTDPSLKDLAIRAKEWLAVSVGSECIVKSYKTDKYGRYLADVYIGQSHLNNALLEHGLAKPYSK